MQPKNSAETILTNIQAKKLVHLLTRESNGAVNPEGPPILDAQGLSLDEIAAKLAKQNRP